MRKRFIDFLLGSFIGLLILIALILNPDLDSFPDKVYSQTHPEVNLLIADPKSLFPPETASSSSVSSSSINQKKITSDFSIPILMYHYIGHNPNPKTDPQRDLLSVTPQQLESQFRWLLVNKYTPIELNTLYAILDHHLPEPEKPVVLTFDDGYKDFYDNAYPLLKTYNFKAVSFIPTGLIGQPAYMTWDQIKEIHSSSLVSFEAHTVNHPNLALLSFKNILKELKDSKSKLEEMTGKPVNFLAYPYGQSNNQIWKAANEAGFIGAVGTWDGRTKSVGYNLPRIRINKSVTLEKFTQKLQ